jgi:hypothetical protein
MRFDRNATQVVFFDLEYYVPPKFRNGKTGLTANPYREGFLIGGVFQRYFPLKKTFDRRREFWIWDYNGNKKELHKDIYEYFKDCWNIYFRKNDPKLTEPIVVGFGVSRFDVPILFAKSLMHKMDKPSKLYDTFFNLRILDLSNVCAPFVKDHPLILAPVSQNRAVANLIDNRLEPKVSRSIIWELYDNKEFEKIAEIANDKINTAICMYFKIIEERNSRFSLGGDVNASFR